MFNARVMTFVILVAGFELFPHPGFAQEAEQSGVAAGITAQGRVTLHEEAEVGNPGSVSPDGLSVHPDGRRVAFTAGTPPREEVWAMENFLPALIDGE